LPAALRAACQRFFIASPPRRMASDEPVVAEPIAFMSLGACEQR
jgi:hypothetical protein